MAGLAAASTTRFLLLTLLQLSSPAAMVRARVTALIVFGDSTVDAGNNNAVPTAVRSNFPPYGRDFPGGRATGRFCNGRVATDFYSEALGLRPFVPAYLDPDYGIQDFAVGVCFASAGSGLDVATAGVFSVIPLSKQVDYFIEYKARLAEHLGAVEARAVVADAVFAISIGTNDFIENYFALTTTRFLEFTIGDYTDFLIGLARSFLVELYDVGARKIGFTGLGAKGCLPIELALHRGVQCRHEVVQHQASHHGRRPHWQTSGCSIPSCQGVQPLHWHSTEPVKEMEEAGADQPEAPEGVEL